MTFEDTFSGNSLNLSTWNVNNYSSVTSEYDGHDALFIADRVAVADGNLVITTVLEPTTFNGVRYNMTSGWIDSQDKVFQNPWQNGPTRFEASMQMPAAGAQGAWPAWWLLPESECWPVGTEIDIIEWWGSEGHYQHNHVGDPISMASSIHYGYGCGGDLYDYNTDTAWFPNMSDTSAPLIDFSAGFHTFGVEINETAVRFYVDNSTSFVKTLPQLCVTDANFTWGKSAYMPWKPMYGIINVAVSQGSNTSWWERNNATMLVDWVRWYQFQDSELPVFADMQEDPLELN